MFATYENFSYLCTRKQILERIMETTTQVFTPDDWAEHEQFVQIFRAAKQRKQEWQKKWRWCWRRKQKESASVALRLITYSKKNK